MSNFTVARKQFARMTGAEVARQTGTTAAYISQLDHGYRRLGDSNIQTYAKLFDVSPSWLHDCPERMPLFDPMSDDVFTCEIIRSETIPDYGILYHVYFDETGDIVPVILASGIQFTPRNWQDIDFPRSAKEIPDIRWMDNRGNEAIMLDGLPRVLG